MNNEKHKKKISSEKKTLKSDEISKKETKLIINKNNKPDDKIESFKQQPEQSND